MPSSHHTTVDQQRLALIHSILHERPINVGNYIRESILECAHRPTGLLFLPYLITSLCRGHNVPEVRTDMIVEGRGWTEKNILSLMELTVATPLSSFDPAAATAEATEQQHIEPAAAAAAPTDPSAQILAAIQKLEERQLGLMTFIKDFAASTVTFIQNSLNFHDAAFPTFHAHYFPVPTPAHTPTPTATPRTPSAASTPSPALTAAGSTHAEPSARGTKRRMTSEELDAYIAGFSSSSVWAASDEEPSIKRDLSKEFSQVKKQNRVADKKNIPTADSSNGGSSSSSAVQVVEQPPQISPIRLQPPREAKAKNTSTSSVPQPAPRARARRQIRLSSSSEDNN
ncbi:hypothetical protein HRI_002234900 [Hibiscus trionum]|uniref:Uncharacterized protein n=1 Tax=Hibiscus trionum TaxID=183268 RepID=A0A9W7M2Y4_HIBTR|nr:hypothetical protein HRI_002234900 [Hibiscus trionum]